MPLSLCVRVELDVRGVSDYCHQISRRCFLMLDAQQARRIEVTGVVQGVGFRPFVHGLAHRFGLVGYVGNDSVQVFIEVMGPVDALDRFVRALEAEAPPLSRIDSVRVDGRALLDPNDHDTFRIVESREHAGERTLIAPDTAVCADCVAELRDPLDRRFEHPFITCTNCGPRLSIIADLPYDRPNTTMRDFEMCGSCRAEYDDPTDRRYHAQPVACHDCGPTLAFGVRLDESSADAPLDSTADLIGRGGIVAVKGVGGFHLVCDALNVDAVAELRRRKHRPDKPFAVMLENLAAAADLVDLEPVEVDALASPEAPIVLARRRPDAMLPNLVAPGSPLVGVMLPYTPVHHLLLARLGRPLVVTSANPSGAPLAHTDASIAGLHHLYDAVLSHDREIRVPVDDSVVRMVGGEITPVRRARGYAPIPARLEGNERHVLAVGGELKNTFCLAADERAWVSQHLGDMENLETLTAFAAMVDEFLAMYHVRPDVVAVDAHPGYLSSRWARQQEFDAPIVEVQHHHAHVAAVMAEHQLPPDEAVLGFAFDGTGYGTDGTIWGGEVLTATARSFDRVAHLHPVPLPGGDQAVKNPHRVALAHCWAADVEWTDDLAPVRQLSDGEKTLLAQQLDRLVSCVPSTSMGRLFDAVASILDVKHRISYEAQAAIELELVAASGRGARSDYRFDLDGVEGGLDQRPVIRAIVDDVGRGRPAPDIAFAFHDALAHAVEDIARRHAMDTVVLSGGVFQNALLTELCVQRLSNDFDVRTHRTVPANDGGLSLGQAFIAAHQPEVL